MASSGDLNDFSYLNLVFGWLGHTAYMYANDVFFLDRKYASCLIAFGYSKEALVLWY